MAIRRYLAMTALEIREKQNLPENFAWMACHFSPYTRGLSNLPRRLPTGAMVILNDFTPIQGHDPEVIAGQLAFLDCGSILLDFQRPGYEEAAVLAKHLSAVLPCPVGVSQLYAEGLNCPVILPPVPPSVPVGEYLSPWESREVWLEISLGGEIITLTEEGPQTASLPRWDVPGDGFAEEMLHCHYRMETAEDMAKFTLWRTREDLDALLEEAEGLGITTAVGLYQELYGFAAPEPSP